MFNAWEIAQTLTDNFLFDACNVGCQSGGKAVIDVVLARKAQFVLTHAEGRGVAEFILFLI